MISVYAIARPILGIDGHEPHAPAKASTVGRFSGRLNVYASPFKLTLQLPDPALGYLRLRANRVLAQPLASGPQIVEQLVVGFMLHVGSFVQLDRLTRGDLRQRNLAISDVRRGRLGIADDAGPHERIEVGATDANPSANPQRRERPLVDPVPNRLLVQLQTDATSATVMKSSGSVMGQR